MAKKLTIDVNKGALGSGFFSNNASVQQDDATIPEPEIKPVHSQPEQPKVKNKGGRPKQAKKKAQYTLTMDPDLYQILRAKAGSIIVLGCVFLMKINGTFKRMAVA